MPAHILLVEDETITRQVIASLLEEEGYTVTPAPNGTVAIELLSQHAFDVVVSDIRMREIDGVDAVEIDGIRHGSVSSLSRSPLPTILRPASRFKSVDT